MVSLTLIGTDFVFIDYSYSHNIACTQSECSNHSNNPHHLNSDSFEDDNFVFNTKVISTCVFSCLDIFPDLNIRFINNYNSNIWQPPKVS